MTRRDYIVLAKILRDAKMSVESVADWARSGSPPGRRCAALALGIILDIEDDLRAVKSLLDSVKERLKRY